MIRGIIYKIKSISIVGSTFKVLVEGLIKARLYLLLPTDLPNLDFLRGAEPVRSSD